MMKIFNADFVGLLLTLAGLCFTVTERWSYATCCFSLVVSLQAIQKLYLRREIKERDDVIRQVRMEACKGE